MVLGRGWIAVGAAGAATVMLGPVALVRLADWLMQNPYTRKWIQGRARQRMLKRLAEHGVVITTSAERGPPQSSQVDYPKYYFRDYHAYPNGNLCWQAAEEAEAMAISAAMVAYPEQGKHADWYMHDLAFSLLPDSLVKSSEPIQVLDAGCGVGQSTLPLSKALPHAKMVAVDLSPHFLEVAKEKPGAEKVEWHHAAMEKLPKEWEGRFNLVTLVGVTHELPAEAVRTCVAELHRVLQPGGILLAMDVDPNKIRKMPKFVYTMFKSTEPDMDDYIAADIPKVIEAAGFETKVDYATVKRRWIALATKP